MAERGYITLELAEDESISFDTSLLKYITLLESEYNGGETVVSEDEDFKLEWPLWQLTKEILTEFDARYGTLYGTDTLKGLRKATLLRDVQLYDLYRMLRVMYHYQSSVMLDLLLSHIIARLLPLDTERVSLMNPRLGRKPTRGLANALSEPKERINESYSVFRELLMTAFTIYLGTFDLLDIIENNYLPQVTSVLSSGDAHVAVLTQGGLLVKGDNTYGQLGMGEPDTPSDRWLSSPIRDVISVWSGSHHTMILTSNQGLLACGSNDYGQLGLSNRRLGKRVFEPAKVELPQVLSVACGTYHSLFLTVEGVFGCGRNNEGQLGAGDDGFIAYLPLLVDTEEPIAAVACGDYYSMLLSISGNVYHTGKSMNGVPASTRRPLKLELPEDAGKIISIACGERHAILINEAREVFMLGANDNGQLGLGNKQSWYAITKHPTLRGIVSAIACTSWSMFVDEQGDLYGCGSNAHNQLGLVDGTGSSTTVPIKIGIRNVISLACGLTYTKILTCQGLFTTVDEGLAGVAIKKEEIVRIAEKPICKKPLLVASVLRCHVCGLVDTNDSGLLVHQKTQRILCSQRCNRQYKAFRVPLG